MAGGREVVTRMVIPPTVEELNLTPVDDGAIVAGKFGFDDVEEELGFSDYDFYPSGIHDFARIEESIPEKGAKIRRPRFSEAQRQALEACHLRISEGVVRACITDEDLEGLQLSTAIEIYRENLGSRTAQRMLRSKMALDRAKELKGSNPATTVAGLLLSGNSSVRLFGAATDIDMNGIKKSVEQLLELRRTLGGRILSTNASDAKERNQQIRDIVLAFGDDLTDEEILAFNETSKTAGPRFKASVDKFKIFKPLHKAEEHSARALQQYVALSEPESDKAPSAFGHVVTTPGEPDPKALGVDSLREMAKAQDEFLNGGEILLFMPGMNTSILPFALSVDHEMDLAGSRKDGEAENVFLERARHTAELIDMQKTITSELFRLFAAIQRKFDSEVEGLIVGNETDEMKRNVALVKHEMQRGLVVGLLAVNLCMLTGISLTGNVSAALMKKLESEGGNMVQDGQRLAELAVLSSLDLANTVNTAGDYHDALKIVQAALEQ